MAKIKVIWKDNSESYVITPHCYTQLIDKAKQYHTVLIAARSARAILREDDLVKDVKIVENDTEYSLF